MASGQDGRIARPLEGRLQRTDDGIGVDVVDYVVALMCMCVLALTLALTSSLRLTHMMACTLGVRLIRSVSLVGLFIVRVQLVRLVRLSCTACMCIS